MALRIKLELIAPALWPYRAPRGRNGGMMPRTSRKSPLTALLALFACLSAPALAQDETAPLPTAAVELVRVKMETDLGAIVLDLDKGRAPATTANFLRYVDEKRLDGTVFYRVMRLDWGTQPNGLIQGGTQGDPKRNLPPIIHEPTNETGLAHKAGAISMARFAPGTAAGDFSIMVSPQPGLDARPDAESPDARPGFAVFGKVVDGMDVVRAIYDAPLSETKGEGFLKGQIIDQPIKILTVRRAPDYVVGSSAGSIDEPASPAAP